MVLFSYLRESWYFRNISYLLTHVHSPSIVNSILLKKRSMMKKRSAGLMKKPVALLLTHVHSPSVVNNILLKKKSLIKKRLLMKKKSAGMLKKPVALLIAVITRSSDGSQVLIALLFESDINYLISVSILSHYYLVLIVHR